MENQDIVSPGIRVTGLLIENNKLLAVKQVLAERSHWNIPGGALEFGETLEEALIREMKEETGLTVRIEELLYICDRFKSLKHHVVDVSFLVTKVGGELSDGFSDAGGEEGIASVRMIPISRLESFGFSKRFKNLIESDFPQRGNYCGEFHSFYG